MRRFLVFLLVSSFLALPALAAPLSLLDDFAEDISEPYDESDPSYGTFVYSCRYPHVDENGEGGAEINAFYDYLLSDTVSNMVPMLQEAFEGFDSSLIVTYDITCNNDDYFSVLVRTEKVNPDQSLVYWEGHVFSRKHPSAGNTFSLPKLLGIMDPDENEEWLEDYQTEKADKLIREMVWELIEENAENIDYGILTEESLSQVFFPEEDFYLNEGGDPVFYLQPGDIYEEIPENAGLFTFTIPLEDILDEL